MVTIDAAKCTGCGKCAAICHEHCMSVVDGKIRIDEPYCSTCTQCVAICPAQALSWDNAEAGRFQPDRLPTTAQMDELFKERRTVRHFEQRPVERELLEQVTSYAAYAPTHGHGFRLVIVDDAAIIELTDRILKQFTARVYALVFKHGIFHRLVKLFAPAYEPEYRRAKPKLEAAVKRGATVAGRPVALVMIIGDKRTPLNLESAQYALYNMALFAQTAGLGCVNLVGSQSILNGNRTLRRRLGLKRKEKIFGLLGLGYPAVRFMNKVEGRALPVQWNGAHRI